MPTYDYECNNCGYVFEVVQSMYDERLTICPRCHADALHRLIACPAGIIFRGSGFYQTDYKRSKEKDNECRADKEED